MSFTSGTQARDGRTVNHDPEPVRSVFDGMRWKARYASCDGHVYDPRPEFAVLDNPILADFRVLEPAEMPAQIRYWMGKVPDHVLGTSTPWWYTREHLGHARRVLTKLTALTKEN